MANKYHPGLVASYAIKYKLGTDKLIELMLDNEETKHDDARQAFLKQMQKASDKKSQGVDYKSKIDSFRKTLQRDQNGNTIRINNNMAIQQSEGRRAKSKGMGMGR